MLQLVLTIDIYTTCQPVETKKERHNGGGGYVCEVNLHPSMRLLIVKQNNFGKHVEVLRS